MPNPLMYHHFDSSKECSLFLFSNKGDSNKIKNFTKKYEKIGRFHWRKRPIFIPDCDIDYQNGFFLFLNVPQEHLCHLPLPIEGVS